VAASSRQILVDFIHVACDWRPLVYNLNATSRQSQANFARASGQFFASTLPEQLFELKNEDAIKKSENLRDTCPC
jgi:hypothetical protein